MCINGVPTGKLSGPWSPGWRTRERDTQLHWIKFSTTSTCLCVCVLFSLHFIACDIFISICISFNRFLTAVVEWITFVNVRRTSIRGFSLRQVGGWIIKTLNCCRAQIAWLANSLGVTSSHRSGCWCFLIVRIVWAVVYFSGLGMQELVSFVPCTIT